MEPSTKNIIQPRPDELSARNMHRRKFLTMLGGTATAAAFVASCKKSSSSNGIDLGSGDTGVLNYAYALEQLEAAFYTQVAASPYANITPAEQALLTDIRDHEIAHREFFKTALSGNAIQALEVDFSSINFSNRNEVLTIAKTFEDLGVSAYNGAGKLLTDVNNLLLAGKIVSVEARHAALIRDLLSNGSFADNTVIDMNGLDVSREPGEVLSIASKYLKSKIDASRLPTS